MICVIYMTQFCSFVGGHKLFFVLFFIAIMTDATINTGVKMYVQDTDFTSFTYILRSGVVR